jgi:hypothetical protein
VCPQMEPPATTQKQMLRPGRRRCCCCCCCWLLLCVQLRRGGERSEERRPADETPPAPALQSIPSSIGPRPGLVGELLRRSSIDSKTGCQISALNLTHLPLPPNRPYATTKTGGGHEISSESRARLSLVAPASSQQQRLACLGWSILLRSHDDGGRTAALALHGGGGAWRAERGDGDGRQGLLGSKPKVCVRGGAVFACLSLAPPGTLPVPVPRRLDDPEPPPPPGGLTPLRGRWPAPASSSCRRTWSGWRARRHSCGRTRRVRGKGEGGNGVNFEKGGRGYTVSSLK